MMTKSTALGWPLLGLNAGSHPSLFLSLMGESHHSLLQPSLTVTISDSEQWSQGWCFWLSTLPPGWQDGLPRARRAPFSPAAAFALLLLSINIAAVVPPCWVSVALVGTWHCFWPQHLPVLPSVSNGPSPSQTEQSWSSKHQEVHAYLKSKPGQSSSTSASSLITLNWTSVAPHCIMDVYWVPRHHAAL